MNGQREVQFTLDGQVVSWHGDLHSFGEGNLNGRICGLEVELRAIAGHEGILSAAFLSLQAIDVGFDDGVNR